MSSTASCSRRVPCYSGGSSCFAAKRPLTAPARRPRSRMYMSSEACPLKNSCLASSHAIKLVILAVKMQADAGKEELFTAVSLMNRTSDRWLLQQPMTSNSKPFPARRVTPTRLLSASRAADRLSPLLNPANSEDTHVALQVCGTGT